MRTVNPASTREATGRLVKYLIVPMGRRTLNRYLITQPILMLKKELKYLGSSEISRNFFMVL